MRRFLPRTLFWQLVLATFAVQTVLLFAYVSYLVVSTRNASHERTMGRIYQQLDLLEPACERLWGTGDQRSLYDVLRISRISPSIDQARITDLDGNVVAASSPTGYHALFPAEQRALRNGPVRQVFKISNGQLEALTPLLRDGKPAALLWLEPNRATSLTPANTVVRIAGTYGLFALLVNILPIFLIVRTMTRPIAELRDATRSLGLNPSSESSFPLPVTTKNEAGELTQSFNTMVHELHEQRSGLLETLALLDSTLDNAPIGFCFFDRSLRYIRANRVFADAYDMPVERFPGCRGPELHPGLLSSQIEELIVEVFQTGVAIRDVELSTASLDANGLKRCYLMNFYPVRTNDQAIRWVGVIAVNITDRLLSEEALRKTEKLAATGRLAASIAHEVNNPLEAVTNILYLLQTDEHLSQAASDWLETAQSELARVSEITQQTLRFYRQSTSPARVNASELMDSVIRLYQPRLQRAGVVVRRKYLEVEPVAAYGGELRQVFANLMGNALDAMPHGGDIVVSTREGCGRAADGSWSRGVRITVSDSGCGMSALTLQRIFEPFFTTKEATGTGLGLWLSSEIVRKHGGVIRVRSAQTGRCGSTFSLFLPRNSAPDTVLE